MNSIELHSLRLQPCKSGQAFTLVELLTILALLGILAPLVVPALARTKANSQRIQCLNNLNEVMAAMAIYAGDNHDLLPPNPDDPGDKTAGHHWACNASGVAGGAFNPDVYADPALSVITPFLGSNIQPLRCPADHRQGIYTGNQVILQGKLIPAARSISMNGAVGTVCDPYWACVYTHSGPPTHPVNGSFLTGNHDNGCSGNLIWSTFGKITSFRTLGAASVFMLCDENPFSINDGVLATCADPANPVFVDYPASWHNGGGGFVFCDGHTEIHQWQGTMIKITAFSVGLPIASQPNDLADWTWLAQHSSARDH